MSEWCFDPRIGDAVLTSNPALIAARLLVDNQMPIDWQSVAQLADWYDEPVTPQFPPVEMQFVGDHAFDNMDLSGAPVTWGGA